MSRQQGKLFIISGPSGVGKTTLVEKFLQQYQYIYNIRRVVTYTTKQPRVTEVAGVDYHFISQSDFKNKIESEFFLEWSGEYGASYGTPADVLHEVVSLGSRILVIDRLGAAQILKKHPDVVLIWIKVSSVSMLLERLEKRKTESVEQVRSRLLQAEKEIEQEKNEQMYHYYIDNDCLESALQGLCGVIDKHLISRGGEEL